MPKNINPNSEDTITFKKSYFYSALVVLAFGAGVLVGFFAWGLNRVTATVPPAAPQQATTVAQIPPTAAAFTPTPDAAALSALMEQAIESTRHFRGNEDAAVTMIEFADFQCPFCGRHFQQVQPQVDLQYVNTDQVRYGYHNMAFLGAESTWAAEAAECAADQDKFWEFHDYLYNNQAGENQGAFSKENLKRFAATLGLNTATFNECLDSGKYTALIQEETASARSMGLSSTPSFLINGQKIVGAQGLPSFQQVIDPLIKQ